MQYKDLPNIDLVRKLMETSFSTPAQNRQIYAWCNRIVEELNFLDNERRKLVTKHGEKKENGTIVVKESEKIKFFEDFGKVLDTEIKDIPELPLNEDSFQDDNCCYPKDKEMWITPQEILKIVKISKKQGD